MTARVRVRGALVAGALLVLGCSTELRANLSEHDANEAVLALHEAGIVATKRARSAVDGYDIDVARDALGPALAVLARRGLATASHGLDDARAESGPLPTPTEERLRFAAATAAELERTLRRLDHVDDARVHLAAFVGPERLDVPTRRVASASVLVRGRGVDEAAVRALVRGAVAGLEADDIAVVVQPSTAQAAPRYERVGPLLVAPASAAALRVTLWALGVLEITLLAAVVALGMRLRARRAAA